MDKIFYNESSSESLGWSPDWLGASDFDDDLIKRIVAFQKKHGLKADGLLGPGTYRRLWTEREKPRLKHTHLYKSILMVKTISFITIITYQLCGIG